MLLRILTGAALLALAAAGEAPRRAGIWESPWSSSARAPERHHGCRGHGSRAGYGVAGLRRSGRELQPSFPIPATSSRRRCRRPFSWATGSASWQAAPRSRVGQPGNTCCPHQHAERGGGHRRHRRFTLSLPGNELVRSVNAVVGETNDGWLSDIRGRHVTRAHVLEAIRAARGGPVAEARSARAPGLSVSVTREASGRPPGGCRMRFRPTQWEFWSRPTSGVSWKSWAPPSPRVGPLLPEGARRPAPGRLLHDRDRH